MYASERFWSIYTVYWCRVQIRAGIFFCQVLVFSLLVPAFVHWCVSMGFFSCQWTAVSSVGFVWRLDSFFSGIKTKQTPLKHIHTKCNKILFSAFLCCLCAVSRFFQIIELFCMRVMHYIGNIQRFIFGFRTQCKG